MQKLKTQARSSGGQLEGAHPRGRRTRARPRAAAGPAAARIGAAGRAWAAAAAPAHPRARVLALSQASAGWCAACLCSAHRTQRRWCILAWGERAWAPAREAASAAQHSSALGLPKQSCPASGYYFLLPSAAVSGTHNTRQCSCCALRQRCQRRFDIPQLERSRRPGGRQRRATRTMPILRTSVTAGKAVQVHCQHSTHSTDGAWLLAAVMRQAYASSFESFKQSCPTAGVSLHLE